MGRVWLAQDVKLDRQVAVKEIIPPKGLTKRECDEARLRTLREARTAASLTHPSVVRVFDTMNIDDQPWIVMEYVPSRSLQKVVDEDGPLEPLRVAEIGLAVLGALRTAHASGVLHRDVKPANVLLADDGRVVLTDFGLATFDGDGQVTRTGVILGSPQFISPERASKGVSLPESDLWSFGATMYAAVEGRAPYARANAIATLTALVTEDPDPSPHAGPLQPVFDALLRKDPAQRPSAVMTERWLRRIIAAARPRPVVPRQGQQRFFAKGWALAKERAAADRRTTDASAAPQQPRRVVDPPTTVLGGGVAAVPVAPAPVVAAFSAPAPVSDAPVAGAPVTETPVAGAPVTETPVTETPVTEGPVVERPAPAVDSPVVDPTVVAPAGAPSVASASASSPTPVVTPVVTPAVAPERTPQGALRATPAGVPGAAAAGVTPWYRNRLVRLALVVLVVAVVVAVVISLTESSRGSTAASGSSPAASGTSATGASSAAASGSPTTPPGSAVASGGGTAASGGGDLPPGWTLYTDPTGFKVAVPQNWTRSRDGTMVYFRDPAGGRSLGIDQTSQPKPDPVADWTEQETSRSHLNGYSRVRLVKVDYFLAAADWEYTYASNGTRLHVLDRGFITAPNHAYAIFWLTTDTLWASSTDLFTTFARTFQPVS